MSLRARARYAIRSLVQPKGLGLLGPDERSGADWDFAAMGLGSSDLPASHTNVPTGVERRWIMLQGGSQTCVSHAYVGALDDRAIVLALKNGATEDEVTDELPEPRRSRSFIYRNSVLMHGGPMVDEGTYLRTCAEGLRRFGAPDESVWRFDPASPLREPLPVAWAGAWSRRLGDYHRIYETGDARITAVRAAIVAGYSVVFGISVPKSFLSDFGPSQITVPEPTERFAGGHAMRWTGYRTRPDGAIEFRTVNSWGRGWRDGGCCWMHEDWAKYSRDVWIVRSLKEVRGEA